MRHNILAATIACGLAMMPFEGPFPGLSNAAQARTAIEGAMPHPMVPLPADGYITRDEFTDFVEIELPASAGDRRSGFEETLPVEGAYRQIEYALGDLELSLLRLYRSYLQHFESNGFEIIFTGIGEELSNRDGFSFISHESGFLSRTPSTASDSNAYILVRSPDERTVLAVSFFSRQDARRMMINAVELEEMELLDLFAPEPEAAPEPEPQPEEDPPVELVQQDAAELETGLLQDGRVIVNAILFEFDRAEILPESAQALDTVADLMRTRPELKLLVVGHTDGVGSFDYNLRLSVERAGAVVAWLGGRGGIDAGRLRAAGAGPMSPVTTNRTESGRAQNRRVELVEIIE
ncbi:MAG: OmpA family protein [Rhodobacteraceae bacterium]|nr:OmpA family protein [Paracoccaceae bacterium]